MGRRKKIETGYYFDETKVVVEIIHLIEKIAIDPLISSMFSWWWLQKKSSLGWDDRQLLKLGIIDINRARASVESSAALELMDRGINLIKSISATASMTAATVAAPEAAVSGQAAVAARELFESKKKPTEADVTKALDILQRSGATFQ